MDENWYLNLFLEAFPESKNFLIRYLILLSLNLNLREHFLLRSVLQIPDFDKESLILINVFKNAISRAVNLRWQSCQKYRLQYK